MFKQFQIILAVFNSNPYTIIQKTALADVALRFWVLSEEEKKELRLEQQLLQSFNAFTGWREENASLPLNALLLSKWFQSEQCSLQNKDDLAVICFFNYLHEELVHEEHPAHLIWLGQHFFDEPTQLAAFILWLLERGVAPETIIESQLLHIFLELHFAGDVFLELHFNDEPSVTGTFYKLLQRCGVEKSQILVDLANTTHMDTKGFVLNRQVNGKLESSNLSGGCFEHEESKQYSEVPRALPGLEVTSSKLNIEALFRVFGIDFIRTLKLSNETHVQTLVTVFPSLGEQILAKAPDWIMQRSMSDENCQHWLKFFSTHFVRSSLIRECGYNLISLAEKFPFYWLLLSQIPMEWSDQLPDFSHPLEDYLKTITTCFGYNQIFLLVQLCIFMQERGHARTLEMSTTVFDLCIKNGFEEDLGLDVLQSLPYMSELSALALKPLSEKLYTTLDQEDFDGIYQQWSEQLSKVNLLKDIAPSIMTTHYPLNKYELVGFVTEHKLRSGLALNALVEYIEKNIQTTLRTPLDERTSELRQILLEMLAYSSDPLLHEQIISDLNAIDQNWEEAFLDDKRYFSRAVTQGNLPIVEWFGSLTGDAQLDSQTSDDALRGAVLAGQLPVASYFLKRADLVAVDEAFDWAAGSGQLSIFTYILKEIIQLDSWNLGTVLMTASDNQQWHIVKYILQLEGDIRPELSHLKVALGQAAIAKELLIVEQIMGMEAMQHENPLGVVLEVAAVSGRFSVMTYCFNMDGPARLVGESIKKALDTAASAGNLASVVYLLNIEGENRLTSASVHAAFKIAIGQGWFALIQYILSLEGDNRLTLEAVEEELILAARSGNLSVIIPILKLKQSNLPENAEAKTLNHAAREGQLQVVDYIINLEGGSRVNPEIIMDALRNAVYYGKLTVIAYIIHLVGKNRLENAVLITLETAVSISEWSVIRYLLQLEREKGFLPTVLNNALIYAAVYEQLPLITHLLTLEGEYRPPENVVADALINAVHHEKLSALTHLLNVEQDNRFTPTIVKNIFIYAARNGRLLALAHMINLENNKRLTHDVIQDALIGATVEGQLTVVVHLLSLGNSKELSANALQILGREDVVLNDKNIPVFIQLSKTFFHGAIVNLLQDLKVPEGVSSKIFARESALFCKAIEGSIIAYFEEWELNDEPRKINQLLINFWKTLQHMTLIEVEKRCFNDEAFKSNLYVGFKDIAKKIGIAADSLTYTAGERFFPQVKKDRDDTNVNATPRASSGMDY